MPLMRATASGHWRRARLLPVLVVLVLAVGALPSAGQTPPPVPPPEQQRALEQVALARARTEMLQRIRALPLGGRATIGDWLTRDPGLDRALRLWARTRPPQGGPRLYSDGICEVDVRVEPAELRDECVRQQAEFPAATTAARLDEKQIQDAARAWPMLWTTGRATPTKPLRTSPSAGWEDVSAEGLELARAAATADACAALLLEAGRLKVTAARRLREFLASSDAVREAVQSDLQRVAKVKVEFAPDQLAVVEVRVGMRDLLRSLTRVHQEHYHGAEFEAADFREMALRADQEDVAGTGLAPPPSQTLLRAKYVPIELDKPAWAASTLAAAGRYEPGEGDSSDENTRTEAARLDGIDRLQRQIAALVIENGVTVAEYLAYHQDLKDDVALLLSGARAVARPVLLPDGGVEVKVELPLRRLWEIVRRDMKLEEVEPPEAPTRDAAPAASSSPVAKDAP